MVLLTAYSNLWLDLRPRQNSKLLQCYIQPKEKFINCVQWNYDPQRILFSAFFSIALFAKKVFLCHQQVTVWLNCKWREGKTNSRLFFFKCQLEFEESTNFSIFIIFPPLFSRLPFQVNHYRSKKLNTISFMCLVTM